jgi:hypothetical protein
MLVNGSGKMRSPQAIAALIAAITSLAVAIVTAILGYRTKLSGDSKLAALNDKIEKARTARNAQLDYEYEARKNLYKQLQPLLFQIAEMGEAAYERITGLAHSARSGFLVPNDYGWLSGGYYLGSTIYRLTAPLAIFKLSQRRLTSLDLSVEPQVRDQYIMIKQLYLTWSASRELAESEPKLQYKPYESYEGPSEEYDPAIYTTQHMFIGKLDAMLDELIVREPEDSLRCISYGEFERKFEDEKSSLYLSTAMIRNLLEDFHPQSKPVLWRMLVTQAHIFRALMKATESLASRPVHPASAIPSADRPDFDWRPKGSEVSEVPDEVTTSTFTAVERFLNRCIVLTTQSARTGQTNEVNARSA